MKCLFSLLITLILISLSGCQTNISSSSNNSTIVGGENTSSEAAVLPLSFFINNSENYFDYQTGLECSAFSSAYILRQYGVEADGMKLFENYPNKIVTGGVFPNGILEFFSGLGYKAEFKIDQTVENIKKDLASGSYVIAFIHVSYPYESVHNTHYVPIVGYDEEYFYFAESLEDFANCKDEEDLPYNRKTKYEDFTNLWLNIDGYWNNPYFKVQGK